jgi:aquaporin NIP
VTLKKLVAEFIGTFALVFAGTGAIVVNETSGGMITQVGIALTFGLIVLAMIYTLGDISGAHINPAVTIGFWVARRFQFVAVLPYTVSQCAGAITASLSLRFLFPQNIMLGSTIPAGAAAQSFVLEMILTAGLMFVIWACPPEREKRESLQVSSSAQLSRSKHSLLARCVAPR